jgi:CRISPR-associated endoribonuclease Cas6
MHSEYNPTKNDFSFQRVRLEFEALEEQRFPDGRSGNVVRGALGWAMREQFPDAYYEFFEPKQFHGPSGLVNRPRPFVLRANHLDGLTFRPSEAFHVDLHLFRHTPSEPFVSAFERMPIGRLRNVTSEALSVSLDGTHQGISSLTLRFVTPTQLKAEGGLTSVPSFPVVFARARDRVRALNSGEPTIDFAGLAHRSAGIVLLSQRLAQRRYARTSSKTGQTHSLGGFTGDVDYAGMLDEFLPILRAAYWTGIGRQTVWGKGVIEITFAA